jgi:PiT family inorganic phosphate transporter
VAGNIAVAWVLTVPAAGATGGIVYLFVDLFGDGAAGPVLVTIAMIVGLAWLLVRRGRTPAPAEVPA